MGERPRDAGPRNVSPRDVGPEPPAPRDPRMAEWSVRISRVLSRFLKAVSGHWLVLANLFMGLYVGLPILSPILYHLGHPGAGGVIQTLLRPFCHQRPERSFFLFGQQVVYSYDELAAHLGQEFVPARYIGGPEIGYKVAMCERDVAIYGMMLLAGLLFWFVRNRLRPLRAKEFGLLILPMAVDGLGQLIGLWTSTWASRVLTGSLFGLAAVWLVYPYLQEGMTGVHQEMTEALAKDGGGHAD